MTAPISEPVLRKAALPLSAEEMAEVAGGVDLPMNRVMNEVEESNDQDVTMGEMDMTGAEAAFLAAQGATFDFENEFARPGQYVFRAGVGNSQFSGRIIDEVGKDLRTVLIYDRDGRSWPVPYDKVPFYRAKGFLLKLTVPGPEFPHKCLSKWKPCPNRPGQRGKFQSILDQRDHLRNKHRKEYRATEEDRRAKAEEGRDTTNLAILEMLQRMQSSAEAGTATPEDDKALVKEALAKLELAQDDARHSSDEAELLRAENEMLRRRIEVVDSPAAEIDPSLAIEEEESDA